MNHALVLINPISGHGEDEAGLRHRIALARHMLTTADRAVQVHVTTGPGDALARARAAAAERAAFVVAWGGDGTVNEVGTALARTMVPLAIVPAGSGNGLARDLGIPLDARAALERAAGGRARTIDAGEVNGSLFFNVAGAGADARIAAAFANRPAGRRGLSTYLTLALDEVRTRRVHACELHVDDEVVRTVALVVTFANSRQYGNGAQIAPRARLDDGALDLVVVEAQPLVSILLRIPALFRGTLQPRPGLVMRPFRRARVSSAAPMPYHVDGEPRPPASQLDITVLPSQLVVIA